VTYEPPEGVTSTTSTGEHSARIDKLVGLLADRDRTAAAARDRADELEDEIRRQREAIEAVQRLVGGVLT